VLKIGPVEVSPGLLLAPMEDVSDLPFRMICKSMGADIVYTEFINAEGLVREAPRTFRKLEFHEDERPMGIQIYGASELSMEQATHIATAQEPDIIDINCGCWVKNVALRGAGAGLLKDLPRLREVVSRVVRSTHLPVTVKTRLGWDAESIRIVEVAQMLEDLGVRALTVHCRTRAQGHKGSVDYSWIPRIKAAVSMPVVLNGDVGTPEDVEHVFARTGCDAVMIGRSAIQHPWIFREARHYLETGELLPQPTLKERAELCLQHLQLSLEHKGERQGLIGIRRHYAGYFRGMSGAAQLRAELAGYKELAQVQERLQELGASSQPLRCGRSSSIAA
jgi:tRNA-dihydrouridine synthase B